MWGATAVAGQDVAGANRRGKGCPQAPDGIRLTQDQVGLRRAACQARGAFRKASTSVRVAASKVLPAQFHAEQPFPRLAYLCFGITLRTYANPF
jgi:hypothetical protein